MVEAIDFLIEGGEIKGNSVDEFRALSTRDFSEIRMCFVLYENCKTVCGNYLECPKYLRDESNGGRA